MIAIPNYHGYFIDAAGIVYSSRWKNRQLYTIKLSKNNTGYVKAVMWNDQGKKRGKLVHRLVAQAFIPNPNKYPMVLHKDNNLENNTKANLMWGTGSMNQYQCEREGRRDNRCSIPVRVRGKRYKSKTKATKALGISYRALDKLLKIKE